MMQKLTAADPETRSADPVAENVERLKELFPEAFTEEKIDFDVLKQVLGGVVDERDEKYGLNWHGKRRARQIALTPSTGTLRPAPDESVDWDETRNLFIEGDNLEVLKLLQKSYAGKIKMIYIDPPYNTGKDFVYSDRYKDNLRNYLEITGQVDGVDGRTSSNLETSGRFHSTWLTMMYPRLRLSRYLLQDDGVLFVSIDDGEIDNLKKLCSELYGEENFVGILAVLVNPRGRHLDKFIAKTHEYVLAFAKNADHRDTIRGMVKEGAMVEEYNRRDDRGPFRELGLRNRNQALIRRPAPIFTSPSMWTRVMVRLPQLRTNRILSKCGQLRRMESAPAGHGDGKK